MTVWTGSRFYRNFYGMTVVRRTPYRNTVQNSQLRRKVTTLVATLTSHKLKEEMEDAATATLAFVAITAAAAIAATAAACMC